jgi:hypothetical protein
MNFITTKQASKILGVHHNHAARLLDNEHVPYEQVGKARAYNAAYVNRVAAKRMIARFRKR